jgi:hypothetical protein
MTTKKDDIFKYLNRCDPDQLTYAIEDIKNDFDISDNELLPIYNEWLFNKWL